MYKDGNEEKAFKSGSSYHHGHGTNFQAKDRLSPPPWNRLVDGSLSNRHESVPVGSYSLKTPEIKVKGEEKYSPSLHRDSESRCFHIYFGKPHVACRNDVVLE